MNNITTIFKTFRIIHVAQLVGMSVFAIATMIIVRMNLTTPVLADVDRSLQVVVVVLSVLMLFIGFRIFKSRIMKIRESKVDGAMRFTQYRSACILWWALIEAPGLLALACFIITANYAFFALGIFHLMVLIMFTPRRENIILLLDLEHDDFKNIKGA